MTYNEALKEARNRNGTNPEYTGTISHVKCADSGTFEVVTEPVEVAMRKHEFCPCSE